MVLEIMSRQTHTHTHTHTHTPRLHPHHSPQSKEELFNLRHSSLRNIIERTFGILKNRFQILTGKGPRTLCTPKSSSYTPCVRCTILFT